MSILIKGMAMPTSCQHCFASDDESRFCRAANEYIPMLGKPNFCPLVPIPPHGALMDRDDFFATCPELVDGYKRITDDLVVIPAEEGE